MTYLIAEFGSSPAPDWDFATWCAAARQSGADSVKIQLWRADHFPEEERAAKRPLEFPRGQLYRFIAAARSVGLRAGCSVFDREAVTLAAHEGCDFLKLAAREQDNYELRGQVLDTGKRVYRSISALNDDSQLLFEVTLFAIQRYPTPLFSALWQLWRASQFFKVNRMQWGWSSHTRGIFDCILAARLGAGVVEKHFALSSGDVEAGHSLLPDQFAEMARRINDER